MAGPAPRRLGFVGLVAAAWFLTCGGPYGLETLCAELGYARALAVLVITPLVFSLPVALVAGELSAALPEEGGGYAWARRGLGPFLAFQVAWLLLVSSVFDMGIYPSLVASYLAELWPALAAPSCAIVVKLGVVVLGAVVNLAGARGVGGTSSVLAVLLLAPIGVLAVALALGGHAPVPTPSTPHAGVLTGVLVAVWSYSGFDSASTFAGEVEDPQRTYPAVLLLTVLLVATTYVVPVSAFAWAGVDPSGWDNGAWIGVARERVGPGLAVALGLGGAVSALGIYLAYVLSLSRLPLALAEDGLLPPAFAWTSPRTGAPTVAIAVLSVAFAATLGLDFGTLVEQSALLTVLALALELVAFVALRIREPALPRPFRVPGGLPVAVMLALAPVAMLGATLVVDVPEASGVHPLLISVGLALLGGPAYAISRRRSPTRA